MVYQITLDLQKYNTQYLLQAVKGDVGNSIQANFTASGTAQSLSGCTVKFTALKPDGTFLYYPTTISGNTATVTDTVGQLCAKEGIVRCSFLVMDGDVITAAPQMFVVVNPNVDTEREVIESDNDLRDLTLLLGQIQTDYENHAFDGADGTPCTHQWNGTTLTVTSASGTSSANLKGETGAKGDTGGSQITALVPVEVATGSPDTSSSAWSSLKKGELFYTNDSTYATRLYYLKIDQTNYLRVGLAGDEYMQIVPVTTNYQGKKIPDVNTKEFKLLVPGQMFLCETETETYKTWVKGGRDEAYQYDTRIVEIVNNNLDIMKPVFDAVNIGNVSQIALGQLFMLGSRLCFRTANGYIPITTEAEVTI